MKIFKFTLFLGLIIFGAINLAFTSDNGYEPGDKVNDFSLKNTDGNYVSLADLKEVKGAIIVFTCNHCPYAKLYEQRIIELNSRYAKLGFPLIAINSNDATIEPGDSFEEMVKRSHEQNYEFPYLTDEAQKVYPQFGATRTPTAFVLSKKDGSFFMEYSGAIDDNSKDASKVKTKYVEDAVNALIKGEKPEVTSTKAVGCRIKAKS